MQDNSDNIPDSFFDAVADEFSNDYRDEGLWLKAFSKCGGDEVKTKATYISMRAEKLFLIHNKEQEQARHLVRAQIILETKIKHEEEEKIRALKEEEEKKRAEIEKENKIKMAKIEKERREEENRIYNENLKIKRREAEERIAERQKKIEERINIEKYKSTATTTNKTYNNKKNKPRFIKNYWPSLLGILIIAFSTYLIVTIEKSRDDKSSVPKNKKIESPTQSFNSSAAINTEENSGIVDQLNAKLRASLACSKSSGRDTTPGWLTFSYPEFDARDNVTAFVASFAPENSTTIWSGSMYLDDKKTMKMVLFNPLDEDEPLSLKSYGGFNNRTISFTNGTCTMMLTAQD